MNAQIESGKPNQENKTPVWPGLIPIKFNESAFAKCLMLPAPAGGWTIMLKSHILRAAAVSSTPSVGFVSAFYAKLRWKCPVRFEHRRTNSPDFIEIRTKLPRAGGPNPLTFKHRPPLFCPSGHGGGRSQSFPFDLPRRGNDRIRFILNFAQAVPVFCQSASQLIGWTINLSILSLFYRFSHLPDCFTNHI